MLQEGMLPLAQAIQQAAPSVPGEDLSGSAGRLFDLAGPQKPAGADAPTPGASSSGGSLEPSGPKKDGSRSAKVSGKRGSWKELRQPKTRTFGQRVGLLAAKVTGVYALWTIYRDGVLVQKYAAWLSDPKETPARRAAAARLLTLLGRSEPLEVLAWAAEHDPEPRVRRAALAGLLRLSQTWGPKYARELRLHPLAGQRQAAARLLGVMAKFSTHPEVIEALAHAAALDRKEDVRLTAIEALASARSSQALELLARLGKGELAPHLRSAVEAALARAVQSQAALKLHLHVEQSAEGFEDTKQPLYATALKRVLAVGAVFLAIEAIGGMLTGSLSLRADATHMAADLSISAAALFCSWMSRRPPTSRRTYGYLKLEPLIGLFSAIAITLMAGHMAWEAFLRLSAPVIVPGWTTMLLALAGLLSNVISTFILYRFRDQSLSLKGAFLHSATDALGSVGIIVAGILMMSFGWFIADPIISFVIVALILHTTWGLAKRSWNVLMDSVPAGLDLDLLHKDLLAVEGVAGVNKLHAWSLDSSQGVATAEVVVKPGFDHEAVLAALKSVLSEKHGIRRSTLELQTLK